jgi:hypothetical protein
MAAAAPLRPTRLFFFFGKQLKKIVMRAVRMRRGRSKGTDGQRSVLFLFHLL